MAVDLAALSEEGVPEGLTIERVGDAETLPELCSTICEGFEMPSWLAEPTARLCAAAGFGDDAAAVSYAGRLDGRIVATSLVYYGAGVAGIYNVATLAACRGRGVGRAMTLAPLLDARRRGYRIGILHSSAMGLPVYRKLGFEQYCEIRHFVLPSAPSAE